MEIWRYDREEFDSAYYHILGFRLLLPSNVFKMITFGECGKIEIPISWEKLREYDETGRLDIDKIIQEAKEHWEKRTDTLYGKQGIVGRHWRGDNDTTRYFFKANIWVDPEGVLSLESCGCSGAIREVRFKVQIDESIQEGCGMENILREFF